MTLSEAIQQIVGENVENDATKRPDWKGYLYVTDYVAEEGTTPESYKVKLVTSSAATPTATTTTIDSDSSTTGLNDDQGTYVFAYSGGTWTVPGDATTNAGKQLAIDAKLWASFIADDWQVGKQADFETIRSGSGGRW